MMIQQEPPALPVPRKGRTRIGDEIYQNLYNRLMSLEIRPGARIGIDGLVREFGVSQTPIREALSRLEAQGLVVKTHLVGYSAAEQMNLGQLQNLFEIRLLLEPAAAARCVDHMTDADIMRLRETELDMRRLTGGTGQRDAIAYSIADGAFHTLIATACGNGLIQDALSRLYAHAHLFRLLYLDQETPSVIEEHARITDAIVSRNKDRADRAMREHIEKSRNRFLSSYPDSATG